MASSNTAKLRNDEACEGSIPAGKVIRPKFGVINGGMDNQSKEGEQAEKTEQLSSDSELTPTEIERAIYRQLVQAALTTHGTTNIDFLDRKQGTHKMRKVHPFGPDIIQEQKISPWKMHGVLEKDIPAEKRATELHELALWLKDIRGNLARQNAQIQTAFAKGKPLGGRLMD